MFRVVIPARYGSARLPGKALLGIRGKPMLQWVYERARASRADEVLIATDDPLIVSAARSFGAEALITAPSHQSGTDRIAELARSRRWAQSDIVVNVQGDEPLIPPALIDQVAGMLETDTRADVATLATPVQSLAEFMDPNIVKVVTDARGRALYFSRAPIPWERDAVAGAAVAGAAAAGTTDGRAQGHGPCALARRHVGIYGYRVGALLKLATLARSPLEQCEKLEQLRALENGLVLQVADAVQQPGPDVNTAADLERVSGLLGRRDFRSP